VFPFHFFHLDPSEAAPKRFSGERRPGGSDSLAALSIASIRLRLRGSNWWIASGQWQVAKSRLRQGERLRLRLSGGGGSLVAHEAATPKSLQPSAFSLVLPAFSFNLNLFFPLCHLLTYNCHFPLATYTHEFLLLTNFEPFSLRLNVPIRLSAPLLGGLIILWGIGHKCARELVGCWFVLAEERPAR